MGYGSGRVGLESGFLLRLYNTPPPEAKRARPWLIVLIFIIYLFVRLRGSSLLSDILDYPSVIPGVK